MATPKQAIILRRAVGTDPLAASPKDVLLSVTHCGAITVPVGSGTMSGGGHLYGVTTKRLRFDVECVGFLRDGESTYTQSVGRMHRLMDQIITGPAGSTLWLWRVLESGTDTNTPADRDYYDVSTLTTDGYTNGTLWNLINITYRQGVGTYPYSPAGILPIEVVAEKAEPSYEGGGLYALSLTLWSANTYTSTI